MNTNGISCFIRAGKFSEQPSNYQLCSMELDENTIPGSLVAVKISTRNRKISGSKPGRN